MNQYEPGRGIALSACASTLFALRQRLPLLRQLVARAVSEPRVGLGLAVSAALLGAQLWVFDWAYAAGRVIARGALPHGPD
jgi:chloramphenicol-sensitive protein RarD